jgi:hypothetical protein
MRPRQRGRSYQGPQIKEVESGCHEWQWSRDGGGYGRLALGGEYVLIHRLFYRLLVGPIPAGHELHHTCNNKRCVNTEHLQPVTRTEHLRLTERIKLDHNKAATIRELALRGVAASEIAQLFGISEAHARRVARGKAWADPPERAA